MGNNWLFPKRLTMNTKNLLHHHTPHYCALDVLRIGSIVWIIIIHSYNFAFQWLKFSNQDDVKDVYKSIWTQWIANGTFSVDNFILLSGFLANISGHQDRLQESNQKTKTCLTKTARVVETLLRRYIRLVPLMMLMILMSVLVLPSLACGPNWSMSTQMFEQWCRPNWYLNLLMVHNFINTSTMCFSHSWYVAVDFQLFVILQLIKYLIPCTKFKSIILILILVAQTSISLVTYFHNHPAMPLLPTESPKAMTSYYDLIYIKPYYWLTSYLVGTLLATFVREKRKFKLGFLIIVPIAIMCCLILSNLQAFRTNIVRDRAESSVYSFLARPIWSLCIATIIASCYKWRPPVVPRRVIRSISLLTYPAYLLHPVLMATFYGSQTESFKFTHYLLIYFTIGNIAITYIFSFLVHILIEVPIKRLTSCFLIINRRYDSPVETTDAPFIQLRSRSIQRPANNETLT